jgi:hypothetical protein
MSLHHGVSCFAISAALGLYCSDGFFSPGEKVRVGRGLLRALILQGQCWGHVANAERAFAVC